MPGQHLVVLEQAVAVDVYVVQAHEMSVVQLSDVAPAEVQTDFGKAPLLAAAAVVCTAGHALERHVDVWGTHKDVG